LPHCWKTMGLCWLQTFISEKLLSEHFNTSY
jgi:hypothetical protein